MTWTEAGHYGLIGCSTRLALFCTVLLAAYAAYAAYAAFVTATLPL